MTLLHKPTYAALHTHQQTKASATTRRLLSLDFFRGLWLVLMSIGHSREFIGSNNYSNMDWNAPAVWEGHSTLDFVQQAFLTTVGASGFFMLMGMSMILFTESRIAKGWDPGKIFRYFLIRGIVLIVIQMTILQAFEIWVRKEILIYVGVLTALGIDMILAALLVYGWQMIAPYYPQRKQLIRTLFLILPLIVILLGLQTWINQIYAGKSFISAWQVLFFVGGHFPVGNLDLDVNFSPIAWFPAVLVGILVGQLILKVGQRAYRILFWISCTMILTWLLLRTLNMLHITQFGEYKRVPETIGLVWSAYFCQSKFPPSINFFIWTLGLNFLLMSVLNAIFSNFKLFHLKLNNPLVIIGQCSLFFFVIHWFVFYGIANVLNIDTSSLKQVLIYDFCGIVILTLLCDRFRHFKNNTPENSFWRIF